MAVFAIDNKASLLALLGLASEFSNHAYVGK